jgi:hypothetical protein
MKCHPLTQIHPPWYFMKDQKNTVSGYNTVQQLVASKQIRFTICELTGKALTDKHSTAKH